MMIIYAAARQKSIEKIVAEDVPGALCDPRPHHGRQEEETRYHRDLGDDLEYGPGHLVHDLAFPDADLHAIGDHEAGHRVDIAAGIACSKQPG